MAPLLTSSQEFSSSVSSGAALPDHPGKRARSKASPNARAQGIYIALAILLPLLAVPFGILLGKSDFFLYHGASLWARTNDAIFRMHDRSCDVLVFGDSTAMTGIDPAVLEHQTGLAACNIAVTNSVLAVTADLPLDFFLAHNHRPRFLVIQLSPESFQVRRDPWGRTIYMEGLLEMLRWGDPHAARHMLLTHPRETLAFAGYSAGYSAFYVIRKAGRWFTRTPVGEDRIVVRNGFFTPPVPPRTSCISTIPPPGPGARAAAASLVSELHRKFAGDADHVIVDIAPIPDCDPNRGALASALRGLASNQLVLMPIHAFNDERHYTAEGSTILSEQVAEQIQATKKTAE